MAKKADGFELKLTHRGGWMVERITAGRVIDVVPVAWSKDFRTDEDTGRKYQKASYHDASDVEARLRQSDAVRLRAGRGEGLRRTPAFLEDVSGAGAATGRIFSERSLEIEVLRRLKAG
jgi:hypothetical protein